MHAAAGLVVILEYFLAAPQDERIQEPPKPVIEAPFLKEEEPRPEFPILDGVSLRTIALRPRFQLTTREFDAGIISDKVNFGDLSNFERTAFTWEGALDVGAWTFSVTALHQESESRLDQDVTFEQFVFPAGSRAKSVAFFGSLEAYRRIELAGGAGETLQLTLLLGINFSKLYLMMRAGDHEASEGFSALWPLPAAGVEARVWLSDRLSVTASARGSRFRYTNPFQLDGGGSQDIRYLFGRFDAGLEWSLSRNLSLAAGYTGIDAFINAASAEDTDTADLKAGGVHAGVTLQF